MIDLISAFARSFASSFRLADAVDIVVIALFLYSALIWFRETASRRVVVGLTFLAAIYFLARTFNLYMTSQLLHNAFAILLIMLVVIFQEDLRRIFERLAAVGTLRQLRETVPDASELDTLVQVAFGLAERKIGALVVVKGNDETARHIQGGIELRGRISRLLLDSIFDPHSGGHDGAVVVDNGHVERFAAHLPISRNQEEIGSRGTRHAAALGLSERCDALLIVVSEERGVVSVAERGILKEIVSPAELRDRLERFVQERFPLDRESTWSRFVVRHWRVKIVSILLSLAGWGLFAYNPSTVQRTFVVPIEYRNVPPGLEVDELAPTETRVTLSASEPAFRMLEPATLKIAVDLSAAGEGVRTIHLSQKDLSLPASLTLYRIEHSTIVLELRQRPKPETMHQHAQVRRRTTHNRPLSVLGISRRGAARIVPAVG